MSDLRPVDRVMLEKIRRIETHIARAKNDNEFAARAKDTSALLTEQDEAGECSECGGTGDAPRQRGMSFTDCAACEGTGLAPEPELCTHPDCDCVDAESECPKGLKTLAPEPVEQIRRDAEEVLPDSSTAQPHNERAQRSSGFDAGGVTGITEPAAPQPECEDYTPGGDCMTYRELALEHGKVIEQRDAAEEKLARLEGLVKDHGIVMVHGNSKEISVSLETLFGYFDEPAAERPTPEREEQR